MFDLMLEFNPFPQNVQISTTVRQILEWLRIADSAEQTDNTVIFSHILDYARNAHGISVTMFMREASDILNFRSVCARLRRIGTE
jgi:hypothetical protein